MVKTTTLLISVFSFTSLIAQTDKIDSLKKQLSIIPHSKSFETTFDLAIEYFSLDEGKGLEYARQAKEISLETNNKLGFAKSLRLIAQMQRRLNNLDSAIYYFKECLSLSSSHHKYEELYGTLNGLGTTVILQAKYDE